MDIIYIVLFVGVLMVPLVMVVKFAMAKVKKDFEPLMNLYGTTAPMGAEAVVLPWFFTKVVSYARKVKMTWDEKGMSFEMPKIGNIRLPLSTNDLLVTDVKKMPNGVLIKMDLVKLKGGKYPKLEELMLKVREEDAEKLNGLEFFKGKLV